MEREEIFARCVRALRRAGAREDDAALGAWVSLALDAHDAYAGDADEYDPDDACEAVYAALADALGVGEDDGEAVEALLLRLDAFMDAVADALDADGD